MPLFIAPKELPDDVKKRLHIVHVSESSIPPESGLKVAPTGVEHTVRLETPSNAYAEAMEVLDLIGSVGVLSKLSITQVLYGHEHLVG